LPASLVANIFVALLAANEDPSHGSSKRFDHVPEIECFPEGMETQATALVGGLGRRVAWCTFGGYESRSLDVVDSPGEGPQVQDAEDGHFNAEKHGGDADFDVGHLKLLGGFDSPG